MPESEVLALAVSAVAGWLAAGCGWYCFYLARRRAVAESDAVWFWRGKYARLRERLRAGEPKQTEAEHE